MHSNNNNNNNRSIQDERAIVVLFLSVIIYYYHHYGAYVYHNILRISELKVVIAIKHLNFQIAFSFPQFARADSQTMRSRKGR